MPLLLNDKQKKNMISLRDLSIKNKLVLMQLFTAVIVLGICVSAFVVLIIKGYKDRKATSAITIANVIGSNCISSLEFLDNAAAKKILSDLKVETDIANATLFDKKGNVFAFYTKPGWDPSFRSPDPLKEEPNVSFTSQFLTINTPVQKSHETIGWIFIRFELTGLHNLEKEIVSLAAILLLVGTGFAFVIAVIVQQYISKPLLNLVSIMQLVESTSDYKIRSDANRKDEIGALSRGFNDMISNIEKRDNEVARSRKQLATVYDTVGDIIFVLAVEEDHFRFVSVNLAFLKVTGLPATAVVGKRADEVIPPASVELVLARYRRAIEEKKTISWEETSEYPTGRLIGEVHITPVFDEKGVCHQLIGSVHDITHQKQTETQIKKLNEELEKKVIERTTTLAETNEKLESTITQLNASVKEMESFSYSVSHDLRSPIRGINGFTVLLKKRYADKLDEDGKKMLDMIVSEAVRMGHLIDDLLAFSRLGRKEIQKTVVDMKALAQAALDEVMKLSDVKYNAKVTIRDIPASTCDSMLLQQVFINLIANALKFSSHNPTPVIEIGAYQEANATVYYIKDNGAGFDMKYYNKLFGVFQRLHSVEEFPGTGIGLSIVHKIIERHGGRVWAESKENGGATFYFTLPAEDVSSATSQKETNLAA
jgi:PAS domain S-box-containing protein